MQIFFIIRKFVKELTILMFMFPVCAAACMNVYQTEFPDNQFENIANVLQQYEEEWKIDEIENRIYINPESIYLAKKQMYLVVNRTLIPISDVHCDKLGYFMCTEGFFAWTCCRCDYMNGYSVYTCQNCRRESCRRR